MKIKILSLAFVLAIIVFAFVGCDFKFIKSNNQVGEQSYVSLDINPEISLIIDEANKVTGVLCENEDAQVMLYGEEDLVGKDLDKAIEQITDLAVELGYIDEENKVVGVMVSSGNDSKATELQEKISNKIEALAQKHSIELSTTTECAYSLLCDLEELKSKYPGNEKIQALTPSKFKLVKSASEHGDVSVEEAIEMESKDLIARVNNAYNRIDKFATKAYEKATDEANRLYEELVGVAKDSAYSEYYMRNITKHTSTYYYGALYQLYTTSQRSFDELSHYLAELEAIKSYEIDEERAQEIAGTFGIENIDELKNNDGKITIESVEDFADRKIKNTKDSQKLNDIKGKFKDKFGEIKTKAKQDVEEIKRENSSEITAIANAGKAIVNAINTMCITLPEDSKAELKAYLEEYTSILENAMKDGLTSEEAKSVAEQMSKKAEDILAKIEQDLTKEELEEIEAKKAEIESSMSEAKQTLDKSVNEAKEMAENYLQERKNKLRNSPLN